MSAVEREAGGGATGREGFFRRAARLIWRRRRRVALACARAVAGCAALLAAILAWPMDRAPYLDPGPRSLVVLDRAGRPLRAFLAADQQWRFPVPLSEISPLLVQATLAAEDKRYFAHRGVDFVAAARAFGQLLANFRVVSGASTLTMQVVKMTDRTPRSAAGKAAQALGALRLELRATKDEILESYLNKAPYGGNLVGCEAGARRYWGKSARDLTVAEAALLAGMPRSPTWLNPLLHLERAKRRRDAVLERMREAGFIDAARCAEAIASPVGVSFHSFGDAAPHLAERVAADSDPVDAIRTTIDAAAQAIAETALRQGIARLGHAVDAGAAIVVDVATAEVRAYVGSPDYFAGSGKIDFVRAARAPGSTLKPFLYGAAIEAGALLPTETLPDAPLDFGDYSPRNFDGAHHGVVSAADALSRSLNIPAIVVLERAGVARALESLRSCGVESIDGDAERYGLGIALGNCEAPLEELAGAYAAIASLGLRRDLRFLAEEAEPLATRVLSEATCASLFEMLGAPIPGEIDGRGLASASPPARVAWKTGTSTGHRDAWAFAFDRQTVVGAWLGNADGESAPELVGATAALPTAVSIFRSLRRDPNAPTWPPTESGMAAIELCAASGLPASRWCPSTRVARVPEVGAARICSMHEDDGAGGAAEAWPATIRGWDLAKASAARPSARTDRQFRVVEPANGAVYLLTGAANGDAVALRGSLDGVATLKWLLDDKLVAQVAPGDPRPLLPLTPGDHRLACVSEDGRVAVAAFRVEDPAGVAARK